MRNLPSTATSLGGFNSGVPPVLNNRDTRVSSAPTTVSSEYNSVQNVPLPRTINSTSGISTRSGYNTPMISPQPSTASSRAPVEYDSTAGFAPFQAPMMPNQHSGIPGVHPSVSAASSGRNPDAMSEVYTDYASSINTVMPNSQKNSSS